MSRWTYLYLIVPSNCFPTNVPESLTNMTSISVFRKNTTVLSVGNVKLAVNVVACPSNAALLIV